MTIKLKYSSVLQISFCKLKKVNDRKRHLVIKGPLGISYLSESIFPSGFKVKLNDKKKVISFIVPTKKHKFYFKKILSLFEALCCSLIFGHIKMLKLQGLGFKFLSVTKGKLKNTITASVGYSHKTDYSLTSYPLMKDTRSVLVYGINYANLHSEIGFIKSLRAPDKFLKSGFLSENFL
jgi:ribosomal protein L6P/L9E